MILLVVPLFIIFVVIISAIDVKKCYKKGKEFEKEQNERLGFSGKN